MKDYKRIDRPYQLDEWENDEWLANRLAFLWLMRETYPRYYIDNGFASEKESIYMCRDVCDKAQAIYYSKRDVTIPTTEADIIAQYKQLELLKNTDMKRYLSDWRFRDTAIELEHYIYDNEIEIPDDE